MIKDISRSVVSCLLGGEKSSIELVVMLKNVNHKDILKLKGNNLFLFRKEGIGDDEKSIFELSERGIQYAEIEGLKSVDGAFEEPVESPYITFMLNNLSYNTKHLPHYNELLKIIALGGNEYTPIIKAVWYHIVGGILCLPIKIGDVWTDTRISVFLPLAAGRGKKSVVDAVKFSVSTSNKQCMELTSLHPEQLVGKTKTGKKGGVKHIYGAFKSDFVIFDEASEFLQAKKEHSRQSLSYTRFALDPLGRNSITKKMVDVENEDALTYEPECSVLMCSHPVFVSDYFVTSGTFRRFETPFLKLQSMSQKDVNKILSDKLDGKEATIDAKKKWSEFLNNIKNNNGGFQLSMAGKEVLLKVNEEIAMLLSTWSKKAEIYGAMMQFSMLDNILKFSSIHAAIKNRFMIEPNDILKGYQDFFELTCLGLTFLDSKVLGEIDYGESWGGAKGDNRECLKWLYERGAIDKESSTVRVDEYKKYIEDSFGLSPGGAKKRYDTLKERGWIGGGRRGKHGSIVFLIVSGNIQKKNIPKTKFMPDIYLKAKEMVFADEDIKKSSMGGMLDVYMEKKEGKVKKSEKLKKWKDSGTNDVHLDFLKGNFGFTEEEIEKLCEGGLVFEPEVGVFRYL